MLGLEINNTEGISHYKDPTRIYQNATCDDCIPSLYLFGVANGRIGNRRLKLQICFDRQTDRQNLVAHISLQSQMISLPDKT